MPLSNTWRRKRGLLEGEIRRAPQFIHKVPNVTASELSGLGLTSDVGELAERVKAMPNHQMLFKTYGPQPEVVKGLPFFELIARSQS